MRHISPPVFSVISEISVVKNLAAQGAQRQGFHPDCDCMIGLDALPVPGGAGRF